MRPSSPQRQESRTRLDCRRTNAAYRQIPADPVAERSAHHQFEITTLEPRHFFGVHRYALAHRAGHTRDIGAPEHALGPERVEDTMQILVDVAVGVGIARITGSAGCLDSDVGVLG